MPRILKFLRRRKEFRTKSTTIKKAALVAQATIAQDTYDKKAPESRIDDAIFSLEHYTPRPSPKTFVVGEVREMPNDNRPLRFSRSNHRETDHKVAITAKSGANTEARHDQHVNLPILFAESPSKIPDTDSSFTSINTKDSKTLANNVSAASRTRPAFKLLLGRQDPASPYFTRRYFHFSDLAAPHSPLDASNDTLHHISEFDPQAFEMYKIYLHTGRIPHAHTNNVDKFHLWMAYWPLMNAHSLGYIVEEPGFADRVMDVLAERLRPGTCPDVETIIHLFGENREGVSDALRQFIVDRFIDALETDRQFLNKFNMPASFSQTALRTTLQRLDGKLPVVQSGCEYHTHGTEEACYKTKITPAEALKEKKLAEARELSAKDAESAVANIIQNGVKSIDWERHRADANRKMREKTGRTWVGFKRLEDAPSVEGADTVEQDLERLKGGTSSNHTSNQAKECHERVASINGTKNTFGLTRKPNDLPVSRRQDLGKGPAVTLLPIIRHNSKTPGLETTVFHSKSTGENVHIFAAELPGSTVHECPHSTDIEVIKYHERVVNCPGAYPESNLDT
ncbi:hypothetical protein EKO04_000118 [Ascochyta lentis]|uniref:Uncharacterized protein n=1 Tax=Ascochyta lentis TaxID=205686 RepID=A0A8H7JAX7_9PLEO|nr:hypothetical protein EKO04_000118 [Ascochyta lentis]